MSVPAGSVERVRERWVDLHAHSTASDGARSPEDLAVLAHAAGLEAVAVTDHDTVAGVAPAIAAGERVGIRVIAGVELSAFEKQKEAHLLGLHLTRLVEFEDALRVFRDARRARAEQIVATLNALGVGITFNDVLANAGDAAIGRPHIAKALIENGWARDSRDAFDRYLGYGRPAFVEKRQLDMVDAIEMIHAIGGIAVLAHPGADLSRARLQALVALGLDGVEVTHPGHSLDERARLDALVTEFSLVPSGGSDWHGASEGTRVLGAMRIPADWLDRQEACVAAHRAQRRVA